MNAIAFLADQQYAKYVRQMVYSVRTFGHWEEDIILLAYEMTDTSWFEKRGVKVIHLSKKDFDFGDLPAKQTVYFAKLLLFHPKFSQWHKIIYLDTDMLIRKDIRDLLKYRKFAAADDCFRYPVIHQMAPLDSDWAKARINKILPKNQLRAVSFNSGMMVIPTAENQLENFEKLCALTAEYWRESAYFDQGILNMHLNPSRDRVPYVYNDYYLSEHFNRRGLFRRFSDKHAVILHIIHPSKPWDASNPYFKEWRSRMEAAEKTTEYIIAGKAPSRIGTALVDFVNRWNVAGVYVRGWWLDRYRGFRWKIKTLFLPKNHKP